MKYIDVYTTKELPKPPDGYRYLDFLGGTKELRCFLVPFDYPRCDFFKEYFHLLDKCLKPIYSNKGIFVRQDASFPVPGLYIVSYDEQFSAFDFIDDNTYMRTSLVIKKIREGMRSCLGINYIHMHYEEKKEKSCNVHYWLMPIDQVETPIIFKLNIMDYLRGFSFAKEREKILEYNEKMEQFLQKIDLIGSDDRIVNSKDC